MFSSLIKNSVSTTTVAPPVVSSSSDLTTIQSKNALLLARRREEEDFEKEIDAAVRLHIGGGAGVDTSTLDADTASSVGCMRFVSCLPFISSRRRHQRLLQDDVVVSSAVQSGSSCCSGSTSTAAAGTAQRSIMGRIIGKSKVSGSDKLEIAMKKVVATVEGLSDKAKISKQRAVELKRAGNTEAALRELKRSKVTSKQLETAQAALAALEQQQAALEQSSLQKELAAAMEATNKQMKQQSKGLLSSVERNLDDAVDLRADVDDASTALTDSVNGGGNDEDEALLEELNELVGEDTAPPPSNTQVVVAAAAAPSVPSVIWPVAPQKDVEASKAPLLTVAAQ
jgi:uncharacterized FlaG/YvyC family protein